MLSWHQTELAGVKVVGRPTADDRSLQQLSSDVLLTIDHDYHEKQVTGMVDGQKQKSRWSAAVSRQNKYSQQTT